MEVIKYVHICPDWLHNDLFQEKKMLFIHGECKVFNWNKSILQAVSSKTLTLYADDDTLLWDLLNCPVERSTFLEKSDLKGHIGMIHLKKEAKGQIADRTNLINTHITNHCNRRLKKTGPTREESTENQTFMYTLREWHDMKTGVVFRDSDHVWRASIKRFTEPNTLYKCSRMMQ